MRENTRTSPRVMSANTQKAQADPIITMKNKNELNTGLQAHQIFCNNLKTLLPPLFFVLSDSVFRVPSVMFFTLSL